MRKSVILFIVCSIFLLFYSCQNNNDAFKGIVGQVEDIHSLHPSVDNIVGISIQDDHRGRFLFVFDGISGNIHRFEVGKYGEYLNYLGTILVEGASLENPRGLEYAREASGDVFYFMDYVMFQDNQTYNQKGLLYRYDVDGKDLTCVDLSRVDYGIGTSEVYGVTKQGGSLYVSFNPNVYDNHSMRVRRGLLKLSLNNKTVVIRQGGKKIKRPYDWEEAVEGRAVLVNHLPGPGKEIKDPESHPYASFNGLHVEPSRALTDMTIDGTEYLWGTVGNDYIYLIDAKSGRGLFFFDRPKGSAPGFYDMIAFGVGDLWTADKIGDIWVINRINVLDNPNLPNAGTKYFRELHMRITSKVADDVKTSHGNVYHTFCHPYDSNVTNNQGIIPNSIRVKDLTGVSDYTVEELYFDPAGDSTVRQYYTLVTYLTDQNPDVRKYVTEFDIKLWKRDLTYFVYPHLVTKDPGLAGTRYLEDDSVLYKIGNDPTVYGDFISRVKDYIKQEYGVEADMDNPYWASRNIIEYVMENYHYPIDSAGYWATYDFEKHHYNSHPGNLKAALTANDNYEDDIIACSGAGCMINGLMRYIGIPSLWVGTSNEDYMEYGFLGMNDDESTKVRNGHRYNHVWLGNFYGWQRFDATPMMPVNIEAYYQKPQKLSQWIFMERGVGSTVASKRVVQNLQSEYWDKMHVPYRNVYCDYVNISGSVRYNLLASYTNPHLFDFSCYFVGERGLLMRASGIQFIDNVEVVIDKGLRATVTWNKSGDWDLDPKARIMVVLEKKCQGGEGCKNGYKRIAILCEGIPLSQRIITAELGKYEKGSYRIVVAKVNDPAIGNQKIFELP